MARDRATKHFREMLLELTSGLLARLFGKAFEYLPQHARTCHPLREVEPPRPAVPLQLQTPGIAADASPVPVAVAEQPCCIKSYRGKMFRVHMGDDLCFGVHQGVGTGKVGENVLAGQVDDAAESGDQMR